MVAVCFFIRSTNVFLNCALEPHWPILLAGVLQGLFLVTVVLKGLSPLLDGILVICRFSDPSYLVTLFQTESSGKTLISGICKEVWLI